MAFLLITISVATLIIIHELGHFLAAKAVGVGVARFSVGFGPALFKKQYRGTEYILAPVLLGGYVRLYGDDPTVKIPDSDKDRAYGEQPVWKRLVIVASGVMANVLVAVLVVFLMKLSAEIAEIRVAPFSADYGIYRCIIDIGYAAYFSAMQAVAVVVSVAVKLLSVLWGIITGAVPLKALGGPIAVFHIAGDKLQAGLQSFLLFMVIISVNLAVFNLLPVPVLDGGHIMLLIVEAVTRRKPGLKTLMVWNGVGIGVVTLLVIAIFVNDFIRYF